LFPCRRATGETKNLNIFVPTNNPQDFEDFIESADKGVILFSFGLTGFSSKDLPAEVIDNFVAAFGRLEQGPMLKNTLRPKF
jgi:hypothetical protein